MSIIYDALKKIEGSTLNKGSKVQLQKIKDKMSEPRFKTYLIYVIIIFVGLILGNTFFSHLKSKKMPQVIKQPASATIPKEEILPEIIEPKVTIPEKLEKTNFDSFILNGIFFSQEEGYALINNRIVKVGDTVGGAQIKRIDIDEVELESNGIVFKLSSRLR